jgi:NitT/TauT family transport system substrate-binding protein
LSFFSAFSPSSLLAAEKLRVGFPSLATALSPTWVGVKKGFWQKHGLDVELIYLSGAITIPSLLSGSVQVVVGSDSEAAIAMIKGTEVVRLGVTTNSLGSSLVAQPSLSSFAELKGKTIGIGSRGFSSLEVRLSQLLLDNGIKPDVDVKFLPIGGGPPARVAALEKGVIIAAMITPPYDLVASKAGMKIFSKVDAPIIAGGINVMQPFVQKNRDALIRFLKGYMESIHFLLTQKEETVRIFSDYLNNRDGEVLSRFYGEISSRAEKSLRPEPKSLRFLLDFIARRYPQAKGISETAYTDLSLLEEIQRSGFLEQIWK